MLEGGPWTFDNHLLLLHHLRQGEDPSKVQLIHVCFWVQVYNIPMGFTSENVGRQIGNFVGEFVEYDVANNSGFW